VIVPERITINFIQNNNTMKKYSYLPLFCLLFLISTGKTYGQEYTLSFANQPDHVLIFTISQGNLTVESYSGSSIIVQSENFTEPPPRADGLRSLFSGGTDNTGIGLTVEESGNRVNMAAVQPHGGDYHLRVPHSIRLVIQQSSMATGNIVLTGHRGEIEIAGKVGNITLKDITGPVNANSVSGNIEIEFSELNQQRPASISSMSGFIDITLPKNTPARFNLQSMSGGIYSDIDLEIAGRRSDLSRMGGGNRINGTMNGGGVEIRLQSMSGDIFLRKK